MKTVRWYALFVVLFVAFSVTAQDKTFGDDVYFSSKSKKNEIPQEKEEVVFTVTETVKPVVVEATLSSERDVDEYNRRYTNNSETYVDEPVEPDMDEEIVYVDGELTQRIVRFHDPTKVTIVGADNVSIYMDGDEYQIVFNEPVNNNARSYYYSGFYDPWYYSGWYSPWRYNYYDPWYYYGYNPWYYGGYHWGWHRPWYGYGGWHNSWYGGGWYGYSNHYYPYYNYGTRYSAGRNSYAVSRNSSRGRYVEPRSQMASQPSLDGRTTRSSSSRSGDIVSGSRTSRESVRSNSTTRSSTRENMESANTRDNSTSRESVITTRTRSNSTSGNVNSSTNSSTRTRMATPNTNANSGSRNSSTYSNSRSSSGSSSYSSGSSGRSSGSSGSYSSGSSSGSRSSSGSYSSGGGRSSSSGSSSGGGRSSSGGGRR